MTSFVFFCIFLRVFRYAKRRQIAAEATARERTTKSREIDRARQKER